jgi:putative serine protease PepD
MNSSPPLWADPAAREPERAWFEQPTVPLPPREDREPAPPEPPRRRRWLVAALVCSLLAVVGLSAALLLGGDDEPQAPAAIPAATGGTLPQGRIGAIYSRVSAGVVQVRTGDGSGTGFVIKDDGTIVTNAHVVSGEKDAKVIFDDSGKPVAARVLGTDASSDLAVLKVDPSDSPRLQPLALADSDAVQVGDAAVAIGYPLGLDRTVTAGIISGLGRQITAPNGFSIDKVLQTDAPVNPGNSGGPLLDEQGRVIGVNSQIATSGNSGNVGIAFAVPSNTVRTVVPKLELGQAVKRAYLGVSTTPSPGGSGAVVREVVSGGPADKAGLKAATAASGSDGDVIVAIEGSPVIQPDDITSIIGAAEPGQTVKLSVVRDGQETTLDVTLSTRPEKVP